MKKFLVIAACVFSMSFISCDVLLGILLGGDNGSTDPNYGNFWAHDLRYDPIKPYRVDAELLHQGVYCNVWVEKGSATKAQAKRIADEYDKNIYGKMIDNFSMKNFQFDSETFSDIMKFADWLADEDGKLCILLLDIKDNFKEGINNSYTAGYFHNLHFLDRNYSNGKDMIFVDTYPGMEDTEEAFSTLAHEMQHLMNFATSFVTRILKNNNNENELFLMDTWIDEGLASAAEYIYKGEHLTGRIDWYNYNGYKESAKSEHRGLIDKGNNFFNWGNRTEENQYANMDDYATVYLFFQWLRLQAGRSTIYSEIISSPNYDHKAVTTVMNTAAKDNGFNDWNILLRAWFAANFINAADNIYGYKNDPILKSVKAPASSSINSPIMLAPGEGVYSRIDAGSLTTMPSSSSSPSIKYASLSKTGTLVSNDSVAAGRTLLTYNVDTYLSIAPETYYEKNGPESGITTGKPIQASVNHVSADRSAMPFVPGPYRIDAGDLIRKNPVNKDQLTKLRE